VDLRRAAGHDARVANSYRGAPQDGLPDGVVHWEGPGLDAWDAWTPAQVAAELHHAAVSWCVVGGWAIDVFLGEQTRPHDDLEIAVLRDEFPAVRAAFSTFDLYSVGNGEVRRLAAPAEPEPDKHQNWVLDTVADRWRADVMLEPGDAETWVFRRQPTIRARRDTMIRRSPDGIPYLAPAGTLLYKAKACRPKDEADLDACLPALTPAERTWLRSALDICHPGHQWIDRLR